MVQLFNLGSSAEHMRWKYLEQRRILSIALILVLTGCGKTGGTTGPDNNPPPMESTVLKGFGLSPIGFPASFNRLLEFFAEVDGIPGGGAFWNGSWRDDVVDGTDAGAIPEGAQVVATRTGSRNVFVFGWRSEAGPHIRVPGDDHNDWTNETARGLFWDMVEEFARVEKPEFLFLGNESDFYFEDDQDDYANWIEVYDEAYARIKTVSPDTNVGPVFNFEHLAGSGVLNGWSETHWGALEAHDLAKVDIVGTTVYPWFQHARASQVPAGYLQPLFDRLPGIPVAITETGWPAERLGGINTLWEVSSAEQLEFVERVKAIVAGRDVPIINWLFLNGMVDPGDNSLVWQLFGSVSLRNTAGVKRPAYDAWIEFHP